MNRWKIGFVLGVATLLLLLSAPGAEAAGRRDAGVSQIDMPLQPRLYIAPANPDAPDRVLRLPFSSVVVPASDVAIVEYNLTIFDVSGNPVFTRSDVESARLGFFGRVFGGERPQVAIPDDLTWDGTFLGSPLGADGALVPDGDYTYQLTITDDRNRMARTPPFNVTVDNTPPVIDFVEMPEFLVFSPDGDGIRDTITIRQSGSREMRWSARILDSGGRIIWEEVVQNPSPDLRTRDVPPSPQTVWDGSIRAAGHPQNGSAAPEGAFMYELVGVDRAGNRSVFRSDWRISLNLRSGDVALRASYPAFSPNGNGVQDSLTFETTVLEADAVASWRLQISPDRQPATVVRRFEGGQVVPRRVDFDGLDGQGRRLQDGGYRAQLFVEYENGTVVESPLVSFEIDTVPPRASIVANTFPEVTASGQPLVFGGADRRGIELRMRIEPGLDWNVVFETPVGRRVQTVRELGFTESEFIFQWDGVDPAIGELPDGFYSFSMEAVDRAGNRGQSNVVQIRKDTRVADVDVRIDGNTVQLGRADGGVSIIPVVSVTEGIDQFLLDIRDERGRVVRSRHVRTPFERLVWNGENNAGQSVAEGQYTVDFQVIFANGNKPRISGVGPIFVDRVSMLVPETPPAVHVAVSPLPFSPDGDGVNDLLQIRMEAQSLLPLDRWTLDIIDPRGNPFTTFGGRGAPDRFITWNGLSASGELVQSAEDYTAVLRVSDTRGNQSEMAATIPIDILVMREGDRLRIRIPSIQFAPNTPDLFDVDREDLDRNLATLRRLAVILDRYPDRRILIEGHAAHVFWQESTAQERAQRAEEERSRLAPLSRARAEEVRQALIILGIDRDRMRIEGLGGTRPVVPHSDRQNVWKNRRVEFILER